MREEPSPSPASVVQRQVEAVLLLLGLLVHLLVGRVVGVVGRVVGVVGVVGRVVGVVGRVVVGRVVGRVVRTDRRRVGHERAAVEAQRAQRLRRQVHGRRAGVVARRFGRRHRRRVQSAHLCPSAEINQSPSVSATLLRHRQPIIKPELDPSPNQPIAAGQCKIFTSSVANHQTRT